MKLPSYSKKKKEEEEQTQEQTQEQSSYKPLPRGVGPRAQKEESSSILPAPAVSTPNFTSSVLNLFGYGDTSLDAQQGRDLMQVGRDVTQKQEVKDWAGRQELLDEYKKLRTNYDPAAPVQKDMDRMQEVLNKLREGDAAAGNEARDYTWQDRADSVIGGTAKNIGASLGSAAGTIGEIAGRSQRMEEEQNREQLLAPIEAIQNAKKPPVLGNIDIDPAHRERVFNPDGTYSTVDTFSREENGKEVLVPTVIKVNGKWTHVDEDTAWKHYLETGENFGKFDTWQEADAYAEQLHNYHEAYYDSLTGRAREAARQVSEAEAANAHEKWETVRAAADRVGESAAEDLQRAKGGLSKLGQAGIDISENVLQMGFDAGVGAMTGGASLPAMFVRTFGSSAQEARKAGASLDEQVLYGTVKGGIEVLTEKMFDGVAGIYGAGAADEITEKAIGKLAKTDTGRTFLRLLSNGAGEGVEELVSGLLDPLAKAIYSGDVGSNYREMDASELLYDALIGAAIGVLGGGVSIATGQNATANEALRANEAPAVESPAVETAPEVAPAEAQPMTQTVVNRSQANKIINDPVQRAAFEAESGITLPGKKSDAARAVMDYYAQQAEAVATEAPVETPVEAPVETPVEAPITEAPIETPVEAPAAPAQVTNDSSPEEIANFLEQRAQAAEARGDAESAAAYRGMAEAERARAMEQQTFAENPVQEAPAINEAPAVPANEEAGISMPVEPGVTMQTTENGPVSQTAQTVRNSPDTNAETQAAIDEAVEAGGFNYLPISNNDTVAKAKAQLERDGFEHTLAQWEKDVVDGKTSASMLATGRLLFNEAQAQGNTEMAIQILSDLQAATTNTAQALQIQRMFASMDPVTRYSALQRQIDKLSDKYSRQLPDGIQISEELKSEYINAQTEEARNDALDKIRDSVAEQLPSTWKDKVRALRYLNMLGNFRTQGRNLIGNTAMAAVTTAKNAVKFGLERLTGAKRTTSAYVPKAFIDAAKADYNANADLINGEAKYSDRAETGLAREAEEGKQIFKGILAPLEWYRNATNWAMTRGDTVFIGARYARTLAGYLKANGMDAETFSGIRDGSITPTKEQSALIDEARSYAAKEAQEATFHDNNTLSEWVSKLGRKETTPKFAKVLAEGVMPFRKTPANVLVRAEEYSPLGFVNTAVKAAQAAKGNTDVTSSDVINQLSKSLTGTGLFLLGMALRNSGHLTGKENDEEQAAFNSLRGEQDYAIKLPDGTSYTLDWVAPASMPLFMGAQMMDIIADENVSLDSLSDVITSLADPMIEMSMLQGLNDALDNLKYADNNLGTIAANAALSYLTQIMTNTLVGQAERTAEDQRYSTYVTGKSKTGKMIERAVGKASAKIPIWDRNQVEYVDAWGRTQDTGNVATRALTNFLSPGYVSQDRSTEVDDELQRLYDAGQNNVFPERIAQSYKVSTYDRDGQKTGERNLTADEYVTFQKTMGQKSLELVKDLMDSSAYKNMTDEARAEAISNIYKYAKNLAAQKVEKTTKKDYEDVSTLSNIGAYYGLKATYHEATSNTKNRDYASLDRMMRDYGSMPKDVRALLEEKESGITKLYEASQAGIKSRDYFTLTDNIKALKPAEGYTNPALWQKVDAIAQSKLGNEQKDAMMRQYFEGTSISKYDACRERGYTPEQVAMFYRIYSESNTGKAKSISAAVKNGFTKKQASELYTLWKKRVGGKS